MSGQPSARDKLARAKARAIADKYIPDRDAVEGSGPWAAWCVARIDELEKQLAIAQGALDDALGKASKPAPKPKARKKLSDKEMLFAHEYIVDRNATQAAIRAGYSAKSAANIGYQNVRKPEIQAVIQELIKERNQRTGWDPDKLLSHLGDEGDADLAEIYDEFGAILPVREWPMVFRRGLITGVETNELWEGTGEDRRLVGYVKKVKIVERTKVKELIGKHVKVQAFKDKVEHDVSDPVKELYAQLAGTGIRPAPQQALGIERDAEPGVQGVAQTPPQPSAIRPRAPVTQEK